MEQEGGNPAGVAGVWQDGFDEEVHVVATRSVHRILLQRIVDERFQVTLMNCASLLRDQVKEGILRENRGDDLKGTLPLRVKPSRRRLSVLYENERVDGEGGRIVGMSRKACLVSGTQTRGGLRHT
jgi:hypothetical protein